MKRRTFLAGAGIGASSIVAIYSLDGSSSTQCTLMHEVVEPSDDYGDVLNSYTYEELRDDAQQVFDEAVTDGSYSTTTQNLNPSEFRYWDEMASYEITKQNETYLLLTYTGEGCESE